MPSLSPSGQATVYPGRRKWRYLKAYEWLESRPEVAPGAKRLYCLLATAAGGANVARNWTVPRAAEALGSTPRSVTNWVGELTGLGLLERQPAVGDETGHRYWFLAHSWMPSSDVDGEHPK